MTRTHDGTMHEHTSVGTGALGTHIARGGSTFQPPVK